MAHEIEHRNGVDSMFSVIQTAWHELGQILARAPRNVEELFALAPYLDYNVEKQATFRRKFIQDTPDGPLYQYLPNASAFVTVRTDDDRELGSVGTDYTVVQNRTAIEQSIGPLVDAGILQCETGGVLRDGADAWVLGKFDMERFSPVVREVFTDELIPYALVRTNHNGKSKVQLGLTTVRVVCANTLAMSEVDMGRSGRLVNISHRGDANERLVDAAQNLMGGIIERYESVASAYKALKGTTLTPEAFDALVTLPALGQHPTRESDFEPGARLAEMVVDRYERRRDTLRGLWVNGKGHTGDHSAWEAYNALTQGIDHDPDLFPSRAGTYRLASLLGGKLRQTKEEAFRGLVDATTTHEPMQYALRAPLVMSA